MKLGGKYHSPSAPFQALRLTLAGLCAEVVGDIVHPLVPAMPEVCFFAYQLGSQVI